jgi:hypothetical protein
MSAWWIASFHLHLPGRVQKFVAWLESTRIVEPVYDVHQADAEAISKLVVKIRGFKKEKPSRLESARFLAIGSFER